MNSQLSFAFNRAVLQQSFCYRSVRAIRRSNYNKAALHESIEQSITRVQWEPKIFYAVLDKVLYDIKKSEFFLPKFRSVWKFWQLM